MRWIANVLLIAGTIAVALSVGSFVGMNAWQAWQNHVFDRERAANAHGPDNHGTENSHPGTRIENGAVLGRLTIPRLRVRTIIREGVDSRVLTVALGHIPGTGLPGQQGGNIGIAGHRDTLFRSLRNIAHNDEIAFETPRATYVYRVKRTSIVAPTDIAVLNPGPASELTLVTCYPFDYVGAAPKRYIVTAELVSQSAGHDSIPQQPVRVVAAAPTPPRPRPSGHVPFDVPQGHSRALVAGKIWLGLDSSDPTNRTVSGWLWVMPERRTIWLRGADTHEPVVFFQDGAKHELFITGVTGTSASGYMVTLTDQG